MKVSPMLDRQHDNSPDESLDMSLRYQLQARELQAAELPVLRPRASVSTHLSQPALVCGKLMLTQAKAMLAALTSRIKILQSANESLRSSVSDQQSMAEELREEIRTNQEKIHSQKSELDYAETMVKFHQNNHKATQESLELVLSLNERLQGELKEVSDVLAMYRRRDATAGRILDRNCVSSARDDQQSTTVAVQEDESGPVVMSG